MNTINQIFIVGQAGAGKGLLAKTLAEQLNWRFVNADLELERRLGRSLVDTLGYDGLQHYQQIQTELLREQLLQHNCVIATDAGVIGAQASRDLLRSVFVVFLDVSVAVQLQRLSVNDGPLLQGEDIAVQLEQWHQQRDDFYRDVATYTLCSDDNELQEHVNSVIELIGQSKAQTAHAAVVSERECLFLNRVSHERVRLSSRQAQCLKLLAKGLSDQQIADAMCLSIRTVQDHLSNIKTMLDCNSSKQLIALYHD